MGKRKSANMTEVEVEYVAEADGKVAPFLGYFPSGYDPTKKKNRKRRHEVDVYHHNKYPSRTQLVVRPEDSNVDFVGNNYAGEAAAGPQLCTYMLGVLDKETHTLKIVPIAANKIFRLEARVKGVKYMDNELLEEASASPVTKENRSNRLKELTNLYGTKKNQTSYKKFQALAQQHVDPLSQEYMDDQLKDVDTSKDPEEVSVEPAANLPPHDPTAVRPEKAYLLDKIILKAEWPYLTDIYELLESNSSDSRFQENGYPTFIVNRIGKVRDFKDQEKKKVVTRILSYITHLVSFYHISQAKDFKFKVRAGSLGNIPQTISKRLLALFVDPESRRVSSDKKTLLVYCILVLTLFVDDFCTSLNDISVDLKIQYAILRQYFLQLGCISSREHNWMLILPVPLKFPDGPKQLRRKSKQRRSGR